VDFTDSQLWVGVILSTDALIVYDPSIQVEGQSQIIVYSVGRELIRQFDPIKIRSMVNTVHGERRDDSLRKYAEWKQLAGLRIEAERLRIEVEADIKRQFIIARHKSFLEEKGKPYEGTNARRVMRHRLTYCWSCKQHLDNDIDIECAACGWIICNCGACGCGY
jgi:hypothetical protein